MSPVVIGLCIMVVVVVSAAIAGHAVGVDRERGRWLAYLDDQGKRIGEQRIRFRATVMAKASLVQRKGWRRG